MPDPISTPIQLARSQRGEVILYADSGLWYSFRFGSLQRYLSASEFHRLHESAMQYEPSSLPDAARSVLRQSPKAGDSPAVTLFGTMRPRDLVELKELLGRAVLMVTALSRLWNDLN